MPKKKFKVELTEDINSDIKSQNMAEAAIAEFRSLQDHAGWQRICKELNKRITEQTDEILDTDIQGEDLNRLRDRRDLIMWFINLPAILTAVLISPPVVQSTQNLDPFNKPEVDNPSDV